MTDPATLPTATVQRPTLLTQRTIVGIVAATLALALLVICILTWAHWTADTNAQRIDWLGRMGVLLILTVFMVIVSFSLPTNGSEEFSGPGISFKINGEGKHDA